MRKPNLFTILLRDRSFCVTRESAQKIGEGLQRHHATVSVRALGETASEPLTVDIALRDVLRIVDRWNAKPKVISLSSYRRQ